MSDEPIFSRRTLLAGLFGGATGAAGAAGLGLVPQIVRGLFDDHKPGLTTAFVPEPVSDDELARVVALSPDLWFRQDARFRVSLGTANPALGGRPGVSMQAAATAFQAAILSVYDGPVEVGPTRLRGAPGDLLAVGSINSCQIARLCLGYEVDEPETGIIFKNKGTFRQLPFEMVFPLDQRAVVRRSQGHEYLETLRFFRSSEGEIFRPDVNEQGELRTDWLVLSRVRNPDNPRNWVFNVGGLYGPATAAFGTLFQIDGAVKTVGIKIAEAIREGRTRAGLLPNESYFDEYQIIVKVGWVEHARTRQIPHDVQWEEAVARPIMRGRGSIRV